jgi:hypothetical protein
VTAGAVGPAYPGDYDQVVGLLRRLETDGRPRDWRRIFDYPWRRPDDPVGYVVREGGEVVAFMGLIRSEMTVGARVERVANLTSWVARDDASGAGALLVLSLQRLRDVTITSLSSNDAAARILGRLGFGPLETAQLILAPTARLAVPARRGPRVLARPEEIRTLLDDADARILDDHAGLADHLLATDADGACYAVYSVRSRKGARTARFHYLSDRRTFARAWPVIHRWLLARRGIAFGEIDARLVHGVALPGSVRREMPRSRLFRSATLRPDQVPELYSEIILLGIL